MQQKFIVKYNGEEVGYVLLRKSGMYYSLICRVRSKEFSEYRLICRNNENYVDLGVCVPYSDGYGMERYIPAKQIGFDDLRFDVLVNDETFRPVSNDRPFIMLNRLSEAYFTIKSGMKGIAFQK